jgi:hypothetical protein
MTRAQKSLALLAALLAGAVIFFAVDRPRDAELELKFDGFEKDGAAKFLLINRSQRNIPYLPSLRDEHLAHSPGWNGTRVVHAHATVTLHKTPPRTTPWRMQILYQHTSPLWAHVRRLLLSAGIRLNQSPHYRLLQSDAVTNAPPAP